MRALSPGPGGLPELRTDLASGGVFEVKAAMAVSESYRVFVLEQLSRVAPVTARSMFGGVGLYAEGLFFALIADDRLYFKVDDTTRADFERLGLEPFRPFGEENAIGYYEAPAEALEEPERLGPWMRKAIDAAARAKKAKPTQKRKGGPTAGS